MKKFFIALVCVTMSMVASAQPQPQNKNQECGKQECCQEKKMCCQEMGMCCGIDSATMKTVMELRKKYHENFRKELRQTLGDEKYIQYLESRVYMQHHRAMHKRMNKHGKGQWGPRRHPMMHQGFPGHHPGEGFNKAECKDKKGCDKDKKKDKKKGEILH